MCLPKLITNDRNIVQISAILLKIDTEVKDLSYVIGIQIKSAQMAAFLASRLPTKCV